MWFETVERLALAWILNCLVVDCSGNTCDETLRPLRRILSGVQQRRKSLTAIDLGTVQT